MSQYQGAGLELYHGVLDMSDKLQIAATENAYR
jgi:hypothetical protein